ncbi:MAG TPA: TolC family protein [Halanaerobiales bacterium]|nr:TolC family protein [Halanaerobiales bacterium]
MNKRYKVILLISIFVLIFSSVSIQAAEYNLEELIRTGMNNNIEIKQLKNELETIQRNMKLTKARSDWQANMSLNKQLIEDDAVSITRDNSEQVNLSINKKFVQNRVTLSPQASYDFDGSEVIYAINMDVDLYPNVPSESIKNLLNLNNQLNQKQKELFNKQAELAKNWINKYLQLVRINESIEVLKERQIVAQNNYDKIQKKVEINEAGQQDLLQAEINLNDAVFNLKQSQQNFKQVKMQLLSDLRLAKNTEIILNKDSKVLTELTDLTNNLEMESLDKGQMVENVVKTSSQFANIINRKEYLQKELDWLKKDDAPQVTLQSSYDSDEEFNASINVSYNIFDSGVQEMTVENKKQEIENSELSLEQLYEQTANNIDSLIDQVNLAQLEAKSSQLKYEKAKKDTEIVKEQFAAGAVEENLLVNNRLNERNALINLNRNRDDIFLNKLDLLILTRPNEIVEEVTK